MNEFEIGLMSYLGREKLEKLGKVKVGIAGAGGLGSNCALHLVRSGFKNLKIVDFDVVEPSNLNRQFSSWISWDVPRFGSKGEFGKNQP